MGGPEFISEGTTSFRSTVDYGEPVESFDLRNERDAQRLRYTGGGTGSGARHEKGSGAGEALTGERTRSRALCRGQLLYAYKSVRFLRKGDRVETDGHHYPQG